MNAAHHRHPRFAELRDELQAHPEWFVPWQGTLFRFQTVDFPAPGDVLSGAGARGRGGRWNPPGLATVYGSTTDTTALEECKAHDRYYGVETKSPRLLVAIEAQLTRTLDLTDATTRRALGVRSAGGSPQAASSGTPRVLAAAAKRSSVVLPMPRLGAATARRKATSSAGFMARRRYATTSLISRRS